VATHQLVWLSYDIKFANEYSHKIKKGLEVVLIDRLQEIPLKRRCICEGFGHSMQLCHTTVTVRKIATLAGLLKMKRCITATISKAKVDGFVESKARWVSKPI
jgi:hypothetical protein